jgi:hypothetical protein
MSSISIPATITSNLGKASGALELQLPLFPAHIREALGKNFHPGTINIKLSKPLIIPVDKYDMDTGGERDKRIKWTDGWVAERFLFKKCRLVAKGQSTDAWIYRSSSTPNSVEPMLMEITSSFIPGLEKGETVILEIDSAEYVQAVIAR